jgi:hypothetical protein
MVFKTQSTAVIMLSLKKQETLATYSAPKRAINNIFPVLFIPLQGNRKYEQPWN